MEYQKSPYYGPGEDAFSKISDAVCHEGFEGLPIDQGRTANEEQSPPTDIDQDDLEGVAE